METLHHIFGDHKMERIGVTGFFLTVLSYMASRIFGLLY